MENLILSGYLLLANCGWPWAHESRSKAEDDYYVRYMSPRKSVLPAASVAALIGLFVIALGLGAA